VVGSKLFPKDIDVLEHYRSKSTIDIPFDDRFDAVSKSDLSEVIFDTTQMDPMSGPGAKTLIERFSKKRVVSDEQSILRHNMPYRHPAVKATPSHIRGHLPVFRKASSVERLPGSDSDAGDHHEWAVTFTVVSLNGTRIGSVSCNIDTDTFRVTLWAVSSGTSLLRLSYAGDAHSWQANPTFSSDGNSFAIHTSRETVGLFDANTGSYIKTIDAAASGISAIAVSKNGWSVAVAVRRALVDTKDETPRAVYGESTETPTTKVLVPNGMQDPRLAYDPRGRRLFLVGIVFVSDGKRKEPRLSGVCWDIITKSNGRDFTTSYRIDTTDLETPLYCLPSNNLALICAYRNGGSFCLSIFTPYSLSENIIAHHGSCVIGFNNRSLLLLGTENNSALWDTSQQKWKSTNFGGSSVDTSDKTVYTYLSKVDGEGFESEHRRGRSFSSIAKLVWDGMPAMFDVKAAAESEERLALFLDGERFEYFEQEE